MARWETLYCEACGKGVSAKSTDRVFHAKCLRKKRSGVLPRYVPEPQLPQGVTAAH